MESLRPRLLELDRLDRPAWEALLRRADQDLEPLLERVRPIVETVRLEGDAALHRFARELDGVQGPLASLRVTEAEIEAAYAELEPALIDAIRFAIEGIRHNIPFLAALMQHPRFRSGALTTGFDPSSSSARGPRMVTSGDGGRLPTRPISTRSLASMSASSSSSRRRAPTISGT